VSTHAAASDLTSDGSQAPVARPLLLRQKPELSPKPAATVASQKSGTGSFGFMHASAIFGPEHSALHSARCDATKCRAHASATASPA
jgi:hypothetical protein